MNWRNIKNILLILLLFINVFLITFMSVTTYKENNISIQVLKSAQSLLNDKGFKCDLNVLPDRYNVAYSLSTHFYSATDLSDILFGQQVPFKTENDTLIAQYKNSELKVKENYFSYSNGNTPNKKATGSTIRRKLKKLGIDMSNSIYDEKNRCFYKMYRGLNLFNMYVKAEVDSDGDICYIAAQWPTTISASSRQNVAFVNEIMNLDSAFQSKGRIKSVELGYELKSSQGTNFLFEPAWRVKVDKNVKII